MLLVNYTGVGHELLQANAAAGVRTLFVVEALSDLELKAMRASGETPAGYLGQVIPDDFEVGRMLGEILSRAARDRGLVDDAGKVRVGIISGELTQAGIARFKGWRSLVTERGDLVQVGFRFGAWEETRAASVAALLLKAEPAPSVLWCANDAMALGALSAALEAGRDPGKDLLIGGVDLTDRALAEVAARRLEVSIGGHVVDGARALILLHDLHETGNLTPQDRTTRMVAVGPREADRYLRFMQLRAWHHCDFTRFSRVRNPQAKDTELSLEDLVSEHQGHVG
jgi:ABC-type sugar transport system substrate-binding protein